MLPSSGVVLVESVVEGFEADAEDAGSASFVASGLLECSKNELAFGVLDGRSNRDHQIGLGHLRHRLGSRGWTSLSFWARPSPKTAPRRGSSVTPCILSPG